MLTQFFPIFSLYVITLLTSAPIKQLSFLNYANCVLLLYNIFLFFQCYDKYLMKSLEKAAAARGHSSWARGPENAGTYNSQPHETGFFCDGGDYDSYYGRFFLNWYSQVLVDHGNRVLSLAKLAFEDTCIAAKVSAHFVAVFVDIYCLQSEIYPTKVIFFH